MCIASLVMDDIIHNMQQQQLIKQVTLPSHSKWSPKMTKKSLLSNNQSLPKSQAGAAVRRQLSKRGGADAAARWRLSACGSRNPFGFKVDNGLVIKRSILLQFQLNYSLLLFVNISNMHSHMFPRDFLGNE